MLFSLFKAIFGVFILMLLWVGVQELIRRKSPHTPEDCDEAEGDHGCHHCVMADTCVSRPSPKDDEET